MQSKSSNSVAPVVIVLLIIFTFPAWIGIAGGLFGIVAGIFGAVIGVVAAIFGVIGGIFGWFFGWNWPFFHWNAFTILAIVVVIVLISRSRKI